MAYDLAGMFTRPPDSEPAPVPTQNGTLNRPAPMMTVTPSPAAKPSAPALQGDPGGLFGGLASMFLQNEAAKMQQQTARADQARSRAVSLFGAPLA